MNNSPEGSSPDEPDPSVGTGSDSPAGSGEGEPESGRGPLEDGASDLVDKIKGQTDRRSTGRSRWTCGGCVLLLIVFLAIGAGLFSPMAPGRLLVGSTDADAVEEAARGIFTYDLPGQTHGVVHVHSALEVAVLEHERGGDPHRLAFFQFRGGWPEWIRVFFLRVTEAYWRWREGFSPGEFEVDRSTVCGRTVRVERAAERADQRIRAVRRRACVRHRGRVKCVLVLGLGERAEPSTRDVIDALGCP